ncbi:MAG: type I-E CRISPR-associated endonuclease Cas1e [bacterium]
MKLSDLHILPKTEGRWSYLYVEHCKVDKEEQAIALHDADGKVPVPCANLALLMLGPGVSITHAAISVLAEHGCLVAWSGESGVRFYAMGIGNTRSSSNLLHQAKMWAYDSSHMQVVRNLYQQRFDEKLDPSLTLRQIRGMEGIRVRNAYNEWSKKTGVRWSRRFYRPDAWHASDPVNRALSAANACLYGICHSAIVASGFSPALGFIHTGNMLSFVYDIADLYKTETTVPAAFEATAEGGDDLERRVRIRCRDLFVSTRLLQRIVKDIKSVLMVPEQGAAGEEDLDSEQRYQLMYWEPGSEKDEETWKDGDHVSLSEEAV